MVGKINQNAESAIYRYNTYTIIKYNTPPITNLNVLTNETFIALEANEDVFIGIPSMNFPDIRP